MKAAIPLSAIKRETRPGLPGGGERIYRQRQQKGRVMSQIEANVPMRGHAVVCIGRACEPVYKITSSRADRWVSTMAARKDSLLRSRNQLLAQITA